MHKEVLSIFNYSLENDFQKSVMNESSVINMQGIIVKSYTKGFKDPFHLFETIEVKDFGELCNIILKGKFTLFKLYYCRKFVNRLYNIYGPDFYKNGRFCKRDRFNIIDPNWSNFSRKWALKEDEFDLSFDVDKGEKTIVLTLFGAKIAQDEREMWPI